MSGLSRNDVEKAVRAVAETIVPLFLLEEVPWAIGGGASLVLQGIPLEPRAVDVITTGRGLRFIHSLLEPIATRRGSDGPANYEKFEAFGVTVCTYGPAMVEGPDGRLVVDENSPLWPHVVARTVRNQRTYVTPLAWEALCAALRADDLLLQRIAARLDSEGAALAKEMAHRCGLSTAARARLNAALAHEKGAANDPR